MSFIDIYEDKSQIKEAFNFLNKLLERTNSLISSSDLLPLLNCHYRRDCNLYKVNYYSEAVYILYYKNSLNTKVAIVEAFYCYLS